MTHPHPVGLAKKPNVGSEGVVGKQRQVSKPMSNAAIHPSIHPSYGTVEWWWAAGSAADHVDRLAAGRWMVAGPAEKSIVPGSCQIYPMTA